MAIVPVTTANSNSIWLGGRVVVRNSNGTPYVIVEDTTDDGIEVWKGNSTTPTSFSEMDNTNNPQTSGYHACSAAIDSSDIIHIAYQYLNGKTSELRYVTFNADGATDVFSGNVQVIADIGEEPQDMTVLGTAIAIDFNNIPHVAYTEYRANMGTNWYTITYNNRIGGGWNSSGVEVEGQADEVECKYPDISIDSDNLPVICYFIESTSRAAGAIGNVNDATVFTIQDVEQDTHTDGDFTKMGICVDSNGDHWISYKESDTFIYIIQHVKTDSWGTWQTRLTNSNVGQSPSIVADGTDIYVFYEDDNNDIVYDMYNGTSWAGETTLDTGTYATVLPKWAFAIDNDSTGRISTTNLMDSSIVDDTNISVYGGSGSEGGAAQSFTGDGGTIDRAVFKISKAGSPTGDVTTVVYAHSGTFGTSSLPTGAALATSDAIDASVLPTSRQEVTFRFSTPFTTVNGTKYVIAIEYGGGSAANRVDARADTITNPHAGNKSEITAGSWVADSGADLNFQILTVGPFTGRAEIDYAFADETASPDIQWNALVLAVAVAPVLRRTHDNYMRHLLTR